jgi:hypothetical protein
LPRKVAAVSQVLLALEAFSKKTQKAVGYQAGEEASGGLATARR